MFDLDSDKELFLIKLPNEVKKKQTQLLLHIICFITNH